MFAQLAGYDLDAVIREQLAFFATRRVPLEWKHHDFDTPPELPTALLRHGFHPGETEALMVYPTASHTSRPPSRRVTIERVTTPASIHEMVDVQQQVWAQPFPWLAASLHERLATAALFLARIDHRAVGTGWIDFVAGSDFADLHGGATLPAYRSRGIYHALFDARAEEARCRDIPFLAVDAAPMSRPILLRRGFQFICETTPYRRS